MKSDERKTGQDAASPSLQRNKFGLTNREEAFCRLYVESGNAEKSYLQAGYVRPKPGYLTMKATDLLKKSKIQDRVTALAMSKGMKRHVSKDVFLEMVMKNYELAQESGDFGAANKSLEILGKSMGYVIDQRQTLQVTASMNKPLASEDAGERIQRLAELAGIPLSLPKPKDEEIVDAELDDEQSGS